MHRIGELIEQIHGEFAAADLHYGHGTDNAWDEAVYLVLTVTGAADDRAVLETAVNDTHETQIRTLASRRILERLPLAYLLERCRYMDLEFHLVEGLVVPRSPIGPLLAELANSDSQWLADAPARVLDLCAGTGCLGLVAALLFPQAEVTLVDLDPLACATAERNVEFLQAQQPELGHDLPKRVRVINADVCALPPLSRQDLVICNPPYVNAVDMQSLPQEFQAEPEAGLAAGFEGLDVILPVLTQMPDVLSNQGLFIGEVGASAAALGRVLMGMPLIWPDLPAGGEGVFLLEGAAFNSHTAPLD